MHWDAWSGQDHALAIPHAFSRCKWSHSGVVEQRKEREILVFQVTLKHPPLFYLIFYFDAHIFRNRQMSKIHLFQAMPAPSTSLSSHLPKDPFLSSIKLFQSARQKKHQNCVPLCQTEVHIFIAVVDATGQRTCLIFAMSLTRRRPSSWWTAMFLPFTTP